VLASAHEQIRSDIFARGHPSGRNDVAYRKIQTAFAANGAPHSTPTSDPSSKPHGEDQSEPSTPSASPLEVAPPLRSLKTQTGPEQLFDYIERFYNATRSHSTIGYLSPVEFERKVGLAQLAQFGGGLRDFAEGSASQIN
jgi:hypothetical protein